MERNFDKEDHLLKSNNLHLVLVLIGKFYRRKLVPCLEGGKRLTVNFCVLKLSCRNFIIKKQVNLAKCAVLRLRKTKPTPDIAKEVRPCIK
jgi:hypothetical protein